MEQKNALNLQKDSKNYIITSAEAKKLGLLSKKDPPPDIKCVFCGKILHARGLRYKNTVLVWIPTPTRCDCPKAVEYWRNYDVKQAELEKQAVEDEARKEMQRKIDRLLIDSGIKRRFKKRTFANFTIDTKGRKISYNIAKEYADNWKEHKSNGDGLYIEGTNGTGKTHLAVAIALQLIEKGVPVICKTSGDLLLDIKRTFDTCGVSEAEVLDVYKNVDLLIIDDLGKEQCSDWSISTLYSIINDRYENMKPIIITTNYNADDIVKVMTPYGYNSAKIKAIISRLREINTVITMAWADIRRKNKEGLSIK